MGIRAPQPCPQGLQKPEPPPAPLPPGARWDASGAHACPYCKRPFNPSEPCAPGAKSGADSANAGIRAATDDGAPPAGPSSIIL